MYDICIMYVCMYVCMYFSVHIHPEAANLLKIYYRSKVLLNDR